MNLLQETKLTTLPISDVSIVIIILVAMVIAVVILMIGVFCLRRYVYFLY